MGAPLSPRDVILSLREFANATLESGVLPAAAELDVHGKAPGQVAMETLWSCRTCMACVEICPVAVEHVPIIVQMRRKLVEDGAMDPLLTKTLQTIHKTGNSFGESKRKRGAWSKSLPFKVKDARKEPVDVLWFVGDYASFDPRNQQVTQTFADLLHEAGVDFGILYDGESNAGNDVRRVGEEGLYEVLAEANIAALAGASFKTIVTTDPHSYNTIRNEYPDFGGNYQIQHYTSFLKQLFASGKLEVDPAAQAARHLPRSLSSRTLQQGIRSTARSAEAAGLRDRRDGPLPRQLLLLRRGRRQNLDSGSRRSGEAGSESHQRSSRDSGSGGVRGELPEGSDDVRGCAEDHRQ